MFVIDASLIVAWLLPDESDARADAVYEIVQVNGGLVPRHWHFEVRNALLMAERRGRIATIEVNEHLGRLNELEIDTDPSPDLDTTFALARTHSLTFYDALYLELALRRQAPLVTLDDALGRAAAAEGLPAPQ